MKIDVNDFKQLARDSQLNVFSEEALEQMFDYYEEVENIEYDPVAFNCEWTEFTENELIEQYDYLVNEDEDEDENERTENIVSSLEQRTMICELNNGNYLVHEF